MQLDFAMLALNADHTANGKLHIFGGGFDILSVPEVPAQVPPFNLVARFICEPDELKAEHRLNLAITKPDGVRTSITTDQLLQFSENKLDVTQPTTGMAILTLVVQFKSFGKYAFDIGVDNQILKTIPLNVTQLVQN
ncbi:MAG TPA: hypothetical protein VFE46_07125 [Pirellulales bacterium]|jgi:hypothetical protein|nr:hypothetical protein [Pirellulales bacterium]